MHVFLLILRKILYAVFFRSAINPNNVTVTSLGELPQHLVEGNAGLIN